MGTISAGEQSDTLYAVDEATGREGVKFKNITETSIDSSKKS